MTEAASAKPIIVRFTARSYDRARGYLLQDADERVCFLLADVVESPTRRIFLVDRVLTLDPACYLRQSPISVVVDPRAKNAVYICFAGSLYNLIGIHSHTFDEWRVTFSTNDDVDDPVETVAVKKQDQIPSKESAKQERGTSLPKALLPTLHIGSWTINADTVEQAVAQPDSYAQVPRDFIGRWSGKVIQTGLPR